MNPFTTLMLFPFQPRRVALAHAHTPLSRVYLIHLLGLVMLAGVLLALDSSFNEFRAAQRVVSTQEDAAAAAVTLLSGELTFALVALIMMCWAGHDEPVIETWRFSLRVSWLFVAQLCWVTGGVGVLVNMIDPRSGPMLVDLGAAFGIAVIVLWSIVGYLRALTVGRSPRGEPADPTCEWCGYNLSMLDITGACPECGRPIAESLRDDARSALNIGHINRSFLAASLLDAERVFRTVRVRDRVGSSAAIFALWMVLAACAAGTVLAGMFLDQIGSPDGEEIVIVFFAGLYVGLFVSWCFFMLASATATVMAAVVSRRVGRNSFRAAHLVVALMGWVIPPWAGLSLGGFLAAQGLARGLPGMPLFLPMWLVANLAVAVAFFRAGMKRMTYLQYANR